MQPLLAWLFGPGPNGASGRLAARWLFLRALGLIFFSAFYSLAFQARGLIAPDGLLPAGEYLKAVQNYYPGLARFWFAPTVFWVRSGPHAIVLLAWVGLAASALLLFNVWPRMAAAVCMVAFLSFVTTLQAFSSYQSDGMLLSAGFISLFLAPPGPRPGWGERHPPPRAAWLLILLEWFTIYFESGVAKIAGHDPEWRNLTAMDDYYQNGPLPTWIAWYAHHLPHWFHASSAALTLALELILVWMVLLPRPFRRILFYIVTPWQIVIILTGNYAFLNYIVLALGIFLLDDATLTRFLPTRLHPKNNSALDDPADGASPTADSNHPTGQALEPSAAQNSHQEQSPAAKKAVERSVPHPVQSPVEPVVEAAAQPPFGPPSGFAVILASLPQRLAVILTAAKNRTPTSETNPTAAPTAERIANTLRIAATAFLLTSLFYAIGAQMALTLFPRAPLPQQPIAALEPFRVANQFGLFAVMTRGRYEIEFQGSNDDGVTWTAYPFRYKPQDPRQAPGIYAPYQPRFEWNLWFASLDNWRDNHFVLACEERLLTSQPDVLALFANNPFPQSPPKQVRAVIWQYWFTSAQEKRQGLWWNRQFLGLYAPQMERSSDGKFTITALPAPSQTLRQ